MSRTSERNGILKVGLQHYRVFIELAPLAGGNRRRESHTVRGSLEQAKEKRAQLLSDKSKGEYVGRSDQRLDDYLESWLTWKRSRVSDRTWERYASLLRGSVIPKLGRLHLQDLTPQHLDEFYAACLRDEAGQRKKSRLSPTTVHHRHVALKMALRRAVELGTLVRNPADFTSPPRPDRPQMRVLNETEVGLLLKALEGTPAELVGFLALMTGARLGELLALRWCDLDLDTQVMYVRQTLVEHLGGAHGGTWYSFKEPKSGKGRPVDLDAGTVARLKAHRAAQSATRLRLSLAWTDLDLVITNAVGEPVRPSTASAQFRVVAQSLSFDRLRFHDTRHTHATILLKTGVPPHVVSKRLGHASVAFTLQVYSWVLPGQQREAAEGFAAAVSGC
jgi:integrase